MSTQPAPGTVPHADLEDLLSTVMAGREYLAEEPFIRPGEAACRPLPPGEGLRLSDLLAAIADLPDPAPEGEAVSTIVGVLRQRGHRSLLLPEIITWCRARWPEPEENVPAEDGAERLPRCAWCGQPCKDRSARYCRPSHRNSAWKARKREQLRREG